MKKNIKPKERRIQIKETVIKPGVVFLELSPKYFLFQSCILAFEQELCRKAEWGMHLEMKFFFQLCFLLGFFTVEKDLLISVDYYNMLLYIFHKAKTKEKYEEKCFFTFFISKLKNVLFGSQPIFVLNFFPVLAFKTINTQLLFWSKNWIWTSKIIPDLWLVVLFWPIKTNLSLYDNLHSVLYTNPPTLIASLRGCVRKWSSSKKRR